MKTTRKLRRHIDRLLTRPGRQLGRWGRFARFQIQLWRFCARRLRENNALAMSSALSFRTIFAMVPALLLVVLVLKSFGFLEDTKRGLRPLLEASGISKIEVETKRKRAETQESSPGPRERVVKVNMADVIERQVRKVGRKLTFGSVGPVGVVLMIWTALTLLTTMERSLNRIFQAPRDRPLATRILLYWSVVTLGPLLLVAASYLSASLSQSFENIPALSWVTGAAGWGAPIIVGGLVLAAVYKLMPNTHVDLLAGIGGAVIATPLWLLVKWGFTLYVSHVARGSLYGTVGLLPLFLIWLNLSWWIFLFGAQLAYTAANVRQISLEGVPERIRGGPVDLLAAAIAVAGPYQDGTGPVKLQLIARKLNLPRQSAQRLLDQLTFSRVVSPLQQDGPVAYVLARPAEKIPLGEVLDIAPGHGSQPSTGRYSPEIAKTVKQIQRRTQDQLAGLTLADALSASAKK